MPEYLSPGVYVEEFDSGPMPMQGVSTDTAGFVGLAERGPADGLPVLVTSFRGFAGVFGGFLPESRFGDYRFLAYSVESYFLNGGRRCYISRVVPKDAATASHTRQSGGLQLKLTAKNPGAWGNKIKVSFTPSCKEEDTRQPSDKVLTLCKFNMIISYADIVETYDDVSFNGNSSDYIINKLAKSELLDAEVKGSGGDLPLYRLISDDANGIILSGGSDGSVDRLDSSVFAGEDHGAGKRTGLQAFLDNTEVSVIAIPGIDDPDVQLKLIAHCENSGNRFAILDLPKDRNGVTDILAHRDMLDSRYAALYHPWIQVFDSLDKKSTFIPPSGAVAGIYARSDLERGVHKAPANEIVRGCTGLVYQYNAEEQNILNPRGVNLIRSFPGQGIRIWGARTCSSDNLWKYVNVQRLFIFLEESIKMSTNWVVFEPNDNILWARVKGSVESFLSAVWRNGALAGASPEEAFFVDIGPNTMTREDIENCRLICVIGAAAVKPAEFIIFRITQKTGKRQ
jgi:phage tail sheath protein FI